jgi:proteasome assembly chaperone (PAC2) family protein
MRGVEAAGKLVDNLRLINIEAERLLKLTSQRFMTLIFTCRRSFEEIFRTIFYSWVFLQLR